MIDHFPGFLQRHKCKPSCPGGTAIVLFDQMLWCETLTAAVVFRSKKKIPFLEKIIAKTRIQQARAAINNIAF
jgi:hypothetical protein